MSERLLEDQVVPEAPPDVEEDWEVRRRRPGPGAPWGYKPNGDAYKRDPATYEEAWNRRRGGRKASGRSSRSAGPASPGRKARPNAGAGERANRTAARAQAVHDLLSIPVAGLAAAGRGAGSMALLADSIVLAQASQPLAAAVAQVAAQDDRIAALVDSLITSSPYAALFTATMPIVMQIAANHSDSTARAMAPMGVMTAEQVVRSYMPDQG